MTQWHWTNWGVVLSGLMAGVLVTVLRRQLPLFWVGINIAAIILYLGASLETLLGALRLEQDVMVAGSQLGIAAAILVVSTYRLHLVGVLVFVAGTTGMATFRIAAGVDYLLSPQDLAILMLNLVTAVFLIVLAPHVHAELRSIGMAVQRHRLRQEQAPGRQDDATSNPGLRIRQS